MEEKELKGVYRSTNKYVIGEVDYIDIILELPYKWISRDLDNEIFKGPCRSLKDKTTEEFPFAEVVESSFLLPMEFLT